MANNSDKRKQVDPKQYYEARYKTKRLVRAGLYAALIWIFLILAAVITNFSLSLRLIAAFILLAACLNLGLKNGLIVFFVGSALSLAYPGLILNIPFYVYFAPYIFIVLALSKLTKSKWQILARVLLGSLLFLTFGLIYKEGIFPGNISEQIEGLFWPLLWLVGIFATSLYDYSLGLLTALYLRRIGPLLEKHTKN